MQIMIFWDFWSYLALYFTYRVSLVQGCAETLNYVYRSRVKVISDNAKFLFRAYIDTIYIALSHTYGTLGVRMCSNLKPCFKVKCM